MATLTTAINILQEIVSWSSDKPMWQRDALRRLIEKENLDTTDINEITKICFSSHSELEIEVSSEQIPLSNDHIPTNEALENSVSLIKLFNVENVNALAANQELVFSPMPGLTVIYGNNGAGKSGYTKILKKACKARDTGSEILPNIFNPDRTLGASAQIEYQINNLDPQTIEWSEEEASPIDLSSIFVFDSACASIHVNKKNEIAFTPSGLDLLPKLVDVCQKVKEQVETQITTLKREQPKIFSEWPTNKTTKVSTLIKNLRYDTDLNDIKALINLSDDELTRIDFLRDYKNKDPQKIISQLENRIKRFEILYNSLTKTYTLLEKDNINRLCSQLEKEINLNETAEMAANSLFNNCPLDNIGTPVWTNLWQAAREYSKLIYSDKPFPYVKEDAVCLLCQQPLNNEAKQRFNLFEEFIKDTTKQKAQLATRVFEEMKEQIQPIKTVGEQYKELEEFSPDLYSKLLSFIELINSKTNQVLTACKTNNWSKINEIDSLFLSELKQLIDFKKIELTTLKEAEKPEHRIALLKELEELEDKIFLQKNETQIYDEITRLKRLNILEEILSETSTSGITRQNNRLTKNIVISSIADQFKEELNRLRMNNIDVQLKPSGGQQGHGTHQIKLTSVTNSNIAEIISEGEHRCIALAAFLAEVSSSSSNSTLIFDDPVSSLDHRWRRTVAQRLIQEAQNRQVVIFTHDIVFLLLLEEFSETYSIQTTYNHLTKGSLGAGIVYNDLPWQAMNVNKRVSYLKAQHQKIAAVYRKEGSDTYKPMAMNLYGLIREAWERAIEEVLLNGAVIRFGRSIQTMRLKAVTDITKDDYIILEENMSKCSTYMAGHDESGAINDEIPNPEELLNDINTLNDWSKEIRRRRQ